MANPYDVEMVKTLRRTVEYYKRINEHVDLTRQDKTTLKHHFLHYLALPHAQKLQHKYAPNPARK